MVELKNDWAIIHRTDIEDLIIRPTDIEAINIQYDETGINSHVTITTTNSRMYHIDIEVPSELKLKYTQQQQKEWIENKINQFKDLILK